MKNAHYPTDVHLVSLAARAGYLMRTNFRTGMLRPCKDDNTPLTETDTAINQLVIDYMSEHFPHVEVVGEEGDREVVGAEYRVICDPVDGTVPFSRGVAAATFCISVLRGNTPLTAAIYEPFTDRFWYASRGEGVWMNSLGDSRGSAIPIRVSAHAELKRANVSLIFWDRADYNMLGVCQKLMEGGASWANYVSVAIMGGLVGSGEYDASIFPGRKSIETPAMQLIVEEAGGRATDMHGNTPSYGPKGETEGHIVSNGLIHDELVELVALCQ